VWDAQTNTYYEVNGYTSVQYEVYVKCQVFASYELWLPEYSAQATYNL